MPMSGCSGCRGMTISGDRRMGGSPIDGGGRAPGGRGGGAEGRPTPANPLFGGGIMGCDGSPGIALSDGDNWTFSNLGICCGHSEMHMPLPHCASQPAASDAAPRAATPNPTTNIMRRMVASIPKYRNGR